MFGYIQKLPSLGDYYGTKKNNFNVLRLILSCVVIFSHSYYIIDADNHRELLYLFSHHQITLGSVCVDGFFIISGFLLVASWENSRGLWDFLRRRALRVFPGLTACLLMMIFCVGPIAGVNIREYFSNPSTYKILRFLLVVPDFHNALPGVFMHNPVSIAVNGSLWTIKYEIYCYVMLALVSFAGIMNKKTGWSVFVFFYVLYNVITPALEMRMGRTLPFALSPDFIPRLATYFFAGSACYIYRDHIKYSGGIFALCFFCILMSCWKGVNFVFPLLLPYCFLYFVFSRNINFYGFGKKVDLSYGVYLYAYPVQQLLVQYLGSNIHPWYLFFIAMIISLFLGLMSWTLVEKRFIVLKEKMGTYEKNSL